MTDTWGRWGPDDEAGSLNFVTPDVTLAASGLVRSGEVLSLAQTLGPAAAVSGHRRSPARFMDRDAGDYAVGARSPDGFRFAEDTIQMATHSGTHLDALSHAWEGDQLYNGHPADTVRSTQGAQRCGAEHLRPVVTRGVLIDLVADAGRPLKASEGVDGSDLERACAASGVTPRSGDAVLIRTGWAERRYAAAEYHDLEPGLTLDGGQWLADREVALVGADNYAVEVQPSAPGSTFPVHLCLLHRHGAPLLENLDLADLATRGRAEFLLVIAPLPLVGSTASPVTPVVVL